MLRGVDLTLGCNWEWKSLQVSRACGLKKVLFRREANKTCISTWLNFYWFPRWQQRCVSVIQNSVVKCLMKCVNYISIWSSHTALFVCKKRQTFVQIIQCRELSEKASLASQDPVGHDCPLNNNKRNKQVELSLTHPRQRKKVKEHPSQSVIMPVPSINTPITHAEWHQSKQCGARRSGFLAAVAPSDWLDRLLEAFDVIGGEARHIDRRIIRVKLAWSFSIIQRKDLGWDSFRSEVWCTFNSLRVGSCTEIRNLCMWGRREGWKGGHTGSDLWNPSHCTLVNCRSSILCSIH